MYNNTLRTFTGRMIIATLGCIIMSIGINVFTTPWNFYTTGLVGYSQFLRSVLVEDYGITLSNIDLAGVIYYALSIPIFIITFKGLGRSFFLRTLVFTAVFSLTTAFIPVPSAPVINDRLTCVLIGSVCVGVGDGMVITCGCTVGGLDMLAMHITKKTGLQVGRFTILVNILLFVLCFFRYDFAVVVYSVLYMVFSSLILDRMHQQNVTVQALIFTREDESVLADFIIKQLGRSVTYWDGVGAYTKDDVRVLCVCLSKYEIEELLHMVHSVDPHAFLTVQEGVRVFGNFPRKLG